MADIVDLWLMKIIDLLNAELERHKHAQEMDHAQVHEIWNSGLSWPENTLV